MVVSGSAASRLWSDRTGMGNSGCIWVRSTSTGLAVRQVSSVGSAIARSDSSSPATVCTVVSDSAAVVARAVPLMHKLCAPASGVGMCGRGGRLSSRRLVVISRGAEAAQSRQAGISVGASSTGQATVPLMVVATSMSSI